MALPDTFLPQLLRWNRKTDDVSDDMLDALSLVAEQSARKDNVHKIKQFNKDTGIFTFSVPFVLYKWYGGLTINSVSNIAEIGIGP